MVNIFGYIFDATGNKVTSGTIYMTLQQDMVSIEGSKIAPFTIAIPLDPLTTPVGVAVTPQGATGATTYGYRIAALDAAGNTTLASATVTTTTGNATLTGSNFNRITWTPVSGAAQYRVYGRTAGSELFIATVTTPLYDDTGGLTPSGAVPASNTTGGYLSKDVYATVGASPAGLAYFVEYNPSPLDKSKPASQKDGYWYNYWAVPDQASVPIGNFVSALRGQTSANYMPLSGTISSTADELTLGPAAAATTKRIKANQVGANKPEIRFNIGTGAWEVSNDGLSFSPVGTGIGDIEGVTAGTGLAGGGTSGNVTLNIASQSDPAWLTGLAASKLTGTVLPAGIVTSSLTAVGTIGTGTWQGTVIAQIYGGTGFNTYATGDILYASAANTLSKRAIGSLGQILKVGASGIPEWADPGAASGHAILSATHTDATAAAVTRGALITGQGASPTWSRLTVGGAGSFLRSDGTDIAWSNTLDITGFGPHTIFNNGNSGAMGLRIHHSTAGSADSAYLALGNTESVVRGMVSQYSSLYTTSNYAIQDGLAVIANGAGGLALATTNATSSTIKMFAGLGTLENFSLTNGGLLSINGTGTVSFAIKTSGTTNAQFATSGGNTFLDATGDLSFRTFSGSTLRMNLTSAGALLMGHSVTSGVAGGNIVLQNNIGLKAVNAAGTAAVTVVYVDTSNRITLNANSASLRIENGATGTAGAVSTYLQVHINGTEYRIPLHATS